jgi:hypothetical protein
VSARGAAIPMSVNSMTRPEPRHDDHGWPSPPDPGDLSRRIAQRRAGLHLSQAQAAGSLSTDMEKGPRVREALFHVERYRRAPTRAARSASRQV